MPTLNPRVNVTLSPSLDRLVQRLAKHQGVSKSQVLRELLETAEPALQRVVLLMDAASKAQKEVRNGLARSLGKAQDSIEGDLSAGLRSLDAITSDLVTQAEAVRGKRPPRKRVSPARGGAPAPKNPPASNRGVKSAKRGAHRAMRGAKG
jgi:hypothetical protein